MACTCALFVTFTARARDSRPSPLIDRGRLFGGRPVDVHDDDGGALGRHRPADRLTDALAATRYNRYLVRQSH